MKKLVIVALFIAFLIGIFSLLPIEQWKSTSPPVEVQTTKKVPIEKKNTEKKNTKKKKKEIQTGSQVHFSLWEDEKNSLSTLPSGMDERIPNGVKHTFRNLYFGYSFDYPPNWMVDNHLPQHYTRFYNQHFRLDITYQNVTKAWTSVSRYLDNTLEFLQPTILENKTWTENGRSIRYVAYKRPAVKAYVDDLTFYQYAFISRGPIVYTFQLKSKENQAAALKQELLKVIKSFQTFPDKKYDLASEINKRTFNPHIQQAFKMNSLNIPPSSFMMGIYEADSTHVVSTEKSLETHFGSQLFYKGIDSTFDHYFQQIVEEKRLPIITFLFQTTGQQKSNVHQAGILQRIIDGEFDDSIRSWAKGVKELESPVFMRVGNEMNGEWSEWSYKHAFNDPDLFKIAYRHFVDIFREEEVRNVFFVWNPNENSDPYYAWNHASMYYPGDQYVDWIGMTAYNFGKTKWGNFRPFDTLYGDLYQDYLISYSSKPLMIGEFGSVETGGDKGQFIREFFEKIPNKYPNVKIAIWFNEPHPPFDFSIDSSPASKAAFKKGMQQGNVVKFLE